MSILAVEVPAILAVLDGITAVLAHAGGDEEWRDVVAYEPHPEVWALFAGLAIAYLAAIRQGRRIGDRAAPARTVAFLGGVLAMWAALDWPIEDLSDGGLLSVHMAQYLLLSIVAPALLLLGCPPWLADRLLAGPWRDAAARLVRRPWLAWCLVTAVLIISHVPSTVELYLANDLVHLTMHAAWLASGVVLWWPVLTPATGIAPLSPPAQIGYLFLQSLPPIMPAAFFTFSDAPVYDAYARLPKPSGLDAVADQQIAGVAMKIGGGLLLWTVIAIIFFRWASREEDEMRIGRGRPRPGQDAASEAPHP